MDDLVSVIVPVYNAQKYLKACIDSIIKQTYKNLDIIIVDDGSTDNSGQICDEYAKKDGRIRVFHKQNGGSGDTRNVGLREVHGEWIVWVDSDDIIHKAQIEILHMIAIDNKADIVVCDYDLIEEDAVVEKLSIDNTSVKGVEVLSERHLYNEEFIKKRSMILTVPWGKICKSNVYENIRFPNKSHHDDTWTTWKIYENTNKVIFVPKKLYYWRNNASSLSRVFDLSHLGGIDAYAEQLEYYHKKNKQRYVEIVFSEYLDMFFWCYNRMKENGMELTELKPYLIYMRSHISYMKVTKSFNVCMLIKYIYLLYYKIPKIIR